MGVGIGDKTIRIAVKDEATNRKIVGILKSVMARTRKPKNLETFARQNTAC
jgi:hypothetical protein